MGQFTTQDLKDKVYEQMHAANDDIRKADAERAVKIVMETIKEEVANGNNVALMGFGTFSNVTRAARKGRNPQTGKDMMIAKQKTVKFKPGKLLKDAVNQ